MTDYGYIKNNYSRLCDSIRECAVRAGREVTLVAVTKSGTDEELMALAELGVADIGENRPGELKRRGELLSTAGYTPRLHEIGRLQRNKVKYIIDRVALIHSVDSLALGEEIAKRARELGRTVPVLIEINSGREEAKSGVMPEDAEALYLSLSRLEGISVEGIMTMGPRVDDPEGLRPYFRIAKEIFDRLRKEYGFKNGGILSMGMSDSYAVAIDEGATMVRVGSLLFEK